MGGNGRSVDEITSGLSSYMDPQQIKTVIKELKGTGDKAAVGHIMQFLKHKDASIRYMAKKAIDDINKGAHSAVDPESRHRRGASGSNRPGFFSKVFSFLAALMKWTVILAAIGGASYGGYIHRDRIVPVVKDLYVALSGKLRGSAGADGTTPEQAAPDPAAASVDSPVAVSADGPVVVSADGPVVVSVDSPVTAVTDNPVPAAVVTDPAEASAISPVQAETVALITEFYTSLSAAYNSKDIDKYIDHFDPSGTFRIGVEGSAYDLAVCRAAAALEFSKAPGATLKIEVIGVTKISDDEYGAKVSTVYGGNFEGVPMDSRFMTIRRNDRVVKRQGTWKLVAASY